MSSDPPAPPDDPAQPIHDESTRTYIHVRPTTDPLSPETVEQHVRRLHRLGGKVADGVLDTIRSRRQTRPTIECLIRSEGDTDTPLTYAFGIDDESAIDGFERHLRGLFPDSYELTRSGQPSTHPSGCFEGDRPTATVEFRGHPARRRDWQTQLTPFESFVDDDHRRVPLAPLIETMAAADCPIVYQALVRPLPDWSGKAEMRRTAIEAHQDTLGDQLVNAIFGPPDDDAPLSQGDVQRVTELGERATRRSFVVNARVVVVGTDAVDPAPVADELATTFAAVSHTCYEIEGRVAPTGDADVVDGLCSRTVHPPSYDRLVSRLPWTAPASRGIVADAREVASFWAVDGAALTAAGRRALGPTPGERTALPRPPVDELTRYHDDGLVIGTPLTQDGQPSPRAISLPPALQPLHVGWFGKTGSGKSTSLITAILANHAATDGADILIDPKGDGMPIDYLRAHYATYGTLENVIYFDCADLLPAFGFFDIRDELDAGVARTTAVEDTVDHYIEILTQIMGRDRFEQAVRSPDIIRYLVKAMFDPVNGDDAFAHRDLHSAIRTMHERQAAPAVADADLERMLAGVVANRARSFDEIMQGVANRVEKIPVDRRLARIFNHVPDADGPHFDLADHLDDDVVIIFDTGELRTESQRVLTLVVLSNLWTALRRRAMRGGSDREGDAECESDDEGEGDGIRENADERERDAVRERDAEGGGDSERNGCSDDDETDDTGSGVVGDGDTGDTLNDDNGIDDTPLVNLYVEEAASIAVSDLLTALLAQSRGFNCSVTLAMQFPAQLRATGDDVYDEVLNNVSTFVTGNVPVDRRLAERLATDDMSPQAVGNRLRALRRGQWLVSLPAGFDQAEPRPFLVRSTTPPPGDPAGDRPLTADDARRFTAALGRARDRTVGQSGLRFTMPSTPPEDADEAADEAASDRSAVRVDSALPHTNRLPPTVEYDTAIHALRCRRCDTRYDPSIEGMRRVIACCASLDAIDRDDVPVCDLNLKLTPAERELSGWTDTQLMFLQAVYNAQQRRYDPLEYDLLRDSMIRLQEYVDIETDAVQDLLDADVLRHDTDHPHRLFSVTPDGRALIGESYRQGVDYGHGQGDLEESSQHVFGIEVARRYLEREHLENPESAVAEVVPYYDLDENRRLDLAGLDADGEVVVTVEIERINHDVRRAVPEDFDKMAACDPEDAIWVVMSHADGHAVLEALNDPLDGPVRVEKTYASTTPPYQFRIDTPGLTAVYPVEWLRDTFVVES